MPEQEVKPGTQEDSRKVSKRTNGTSTMPIPVSHGKVISVEETTISELVNKEVISYPRDFTIGDQEAIEDKKVYEVTVKIGNTDCSSDTDGFVCSLGAYEAMFDSQSVDRLLKHIDRPEASPPDLVGEEVPVRYFNGDGYTIQTTDLNSINRWKLDNGHFKWNSEEGYINRWYVTPARAVGAITSISLLGTYIIVFLLPELFFNLSTTVMNIMTGILILTLIPAMIYTEKVMDKITKTLCNYISD